MTSRATANSKKVMGQGVMKTYIIYLQSSEYFVTRQQICNFSILGMIRKTVTSVGTAKGTICAF